MKLSSRQILFFLAAVTPVGKLILMPPQLAAAARGDLLLPVLAQLPVQAALVFCVLLAARDGRTLHEMLARRIGAWGAAAVSAALALFLLYAAFVPLIEQKLLVQSIFYDTLPSYVVFAPFFVLSAYLCSRPAAGTGRLFDFLAPLSLFGMAGILLFSVGEADFGALLPVGAAGAGGFLQGARRACAWFYDAALLLPLLGRFDYKKGLAAKGAAAYLAGGAVLLAFLATFYGVFGDIAVIQVFAFAKMSHFFAGLTVLGRIDYLFIFSLAFVMIFYAAMPIQGAVQLAADCLPQSGKWLPALLSCAVNAAMLALLYAFNFYSDRIIDLFTGRLFFLIPAAGAASALLVLLLGRRRRES